MRDIFVSYSSKDRATAMRVVAGLERRGWSAWYDVQIPPGRQYDDVIVEVLGSVKCVVVLWSTASSKSMWVKNEASDAMVRRNLIPATIEPGAPIPFEFRRLQAADLSHWDGDPAAPAFVQLCDAVATLIASGPVAAGDPDEPDRPNIAPAPSNTASAAPAMPPTTPPPPVEAPASRPMSLRNKILIGLAVVVGGPVLVSLLFGGMAASQNDVAPPLPVPGPVLPGAGAQTTSPLAWRDRSLRYSGTVTWDSRATDAQLRTRVFDGRTGRVLADTMLPASVRVDAPGRYVFHSEVQIAADSETPYPHAHTLNLVFEMLNGRLTLVRNCTAPNDCYEVGT